MQLLLDSSGNQLVAALAESGRILAQRAVPNGSAESRDIRALTEALLPAGRSLRELVAIGVGNGPGSFIGTRVAVSFANGLAVAGSIPVHAIPTLAAWASPNAGAVILRDARRGEAYLYVAGFPLDSTRLVPLEGLPRELAALPRQDRVIAESPAPADKRGKEWTTAVESAVLTAAAGQALEWAAHVPPAGLLALLPHCPPQEYVEPVYLRGFL
jgi:tRNA threonylcarbamoyladenosine biosynthesis protein TsaB